MKKERKGEKERKGGKRKLFGKGERCLKQQMGRKIGMEKPR